MPLPNSLLVFGGPGCGKTEGLIKMASQDIEASAPGAVAFTSFTRQAAYGARARAADKYGYAEKELPWFRTLHSLAFAAIGMTRNEIMQRSHYKELCKNIGYQMGNGIEIGPCTVGPEGDVCLSLTEYARATMRPLKEIYREHSATVPWSHVQNFERKLREYKQAHGVFDFTDVLEMYVAEGQPINVTSAYIDEAQDLTRLQWRAAEVAFQNCTKTIIGGDDDQAIYKWAGANVDDFLSIDCPRVVLDHSYRLPQEILTLANRVARRIGRRQTKSFSSSGTPGSVRFHTSAHRVKMSDGRWLLLARNRYRLEELEAVIRDQGFLYSKHGRLSYKPDFVHAIRAYETLRAGRSVYIEDALSAMDFAGIEINEQKFEAGMLVTRDQIGMPEGAPIWWRAFKRVPEREKAYLVSALRRGEDPKAPPRIRLDTIHGAKGAEEENVVVMTDISRKCVDGMRLSPDDEHRVFYVALTRASVNLHIVAPQSSQFYSI